MVLAIVVVNQSIMGWPPLQDKLSTRTRWFQPDLRQSRGGGLGWGDVARPIARLTRVRSPNSPHPNPRLSKTWS
jgi:hypothetical protein